MFLKWLSKNKEDTFFLSISNFPLRLTCSYLGLGSQADTILNLLLLREMSNPKGKLIQLIQLKQLKHFQRK